MMQKYDLGNYQNQVPIFFKVFFILFENLEKDYYYPVNFEFN